MAPTSGKRAGSAPPLSRLAAALEYYSAAADDAPRTGGSVSLPLALAAASPAARAMVEERAAATAELRQRERRVFAVAGVSVLRRGDAARCVGADGRTLLEEKDHRSSVPRPPQLMLSVLAGGADGGGLAGDGLRNMLWWLQRCRRADNAFAVALRVSGRRGAGKKRDLVDTADLDWAGGALDSAAPPPLPVAALGGVLREVHLEAMELTPAAAKAAPRLFPGAAVLRLVDCSAKYDPSLRDAAGFLSCDGAAHGWRGVEYMACSGCGGDAFWTIVARLFLPPAAGPLRVLSVEHSPVTGKQLTAVVEAVVAQRQQPAAAGCPPLELELSSLKGDALADVGRWLPAVAGDDGAGLRALMLPSTPFSPEVLAVALAECAGRYARGHGGAALRLHLLDTRWNTGVTDAFLQHVMAAGLRATHMRVAGTAMTAKTSALFATKVSP